MTRSLVWSLCLGAAIVGSAAAAGLSRSAAFEPTNPALKLAMAGQADPLAPNAGLHSRFDAASDPDNDTYRFAANVRPAGPSALTELKPLPYLDPVGALDAEERQELQVEYALSAPARATGLSVDLEFAPRAAVSVGPEGSRVKSVGGEVRLGQRLGNVLSKFDGSSATMDRPSWYFFAATDGAAVTWAPESMAAGARPGLRYQEDRIVVGKAQVGLTMEARGMQASVGFTNREVSNGKESVDENFVGASFTMRH